MGNAKKSEGCSTIFGICEFLLKIHKEFFRCGMTYYRTYMKQRFGFPLGTITGGYVSAVEGCVHFYSNLEAF
jgi:hypothetical protein